VISSASIADSDRAFARYSSVPSLKVCDRDRSRRPERVALAAIRAGSRQEPPSTQLPDRRLPQDAEDLIQETLLAAWRAFDQFEERASLRPGCTGSPTAR
jgi:hypothetical protein